MRFGVGTGHSDEYVAKQRLRMLGGCMGTAAGTYWSADGRSVRCPEGIDSGVWGEEYSQQHAFSYHNLYWVDYRMQAIREVRPRMDEYEMVEVVGPTANRQAIMLIYRSYSEGEKYRLCAGKTGARPNERTCTGFERTGPKHRNRGQFYMTVPAPLPSAHLQLVPLDEIEEARDWHSWLGKRFDLDTVGADGRPRRLHGPQH